MKRLVFSLLVALLALPLGAATAQDGDQAPPASYADVADQFSALEEEASAASEEVIDLFLSGDLETLHAHLNEEARAAITLPMLEQAYGMLTAGPPVGEQIGKRVLMVTGEISAAAAVYAWGEQQVQFTVAVDQSGQIAGLNFQPVLLLPDDPAAGIEIPVSFRLPFDGLWFVGWGGPDALHNYHVDAPPQRHAYDFLVWKDGSTYSGRGKEVEDYYAYGQPVLAPADGTVVRVVDGLKDVKPQIETDAENPAGNHVVIQVADEVYLLIAHLQAGTLLVAEGDTVAAGQEIGRVGNSGNTSEPHIHIHLQDTPDMFTYSEDGRITGLSDAIGLPLAFSAIEVNGKPFAKTVPLGGQFAQQRGEPACCTGL